MPSKPTVANADRGVLAGAGLAFGGAGLFAGAGAASGGPSPCPPAQVFERPPEGWVPQGSVPAGGSATAPALNAAGAPDGSTVRAIEPPAAGPLSVPGTPVSESLVSESPDSGTLAGVQLTLLTDPSNAGG